MAMIGCAGRTAATGPGARWIARQGGLCTESTARADAALSRLTDASHGNGLRIATLAGQSPVAYAWPDGSIFVSRGLLALLDDEELTAAIAHEVGHLMSDGHFRSAASLGGRPAARPAIAGRDIESRADAAGVELLRRRGLAPQSMQRMLVKVRSSSPHLSREQAGAIDRRIEMLTSTVPNP